LDLPTLLVIIILVVTVAGAGGGYAVHRRRQKLKNAWMPTQPAQVPEAQAPPGALQVQPVGQSGVILYPQEATPPAYASPEPAYQFLPPSTSGQSGNRTWNEPASNYADSNRREDYAGGESEFSSPKEEYARPSETSEASRDIGKPQDWLLNKGNELANELPEPFGRWADKGVEFGAGETTELQGKLNDIIDKGVDRGEGYAGGDHPSGGSRPSGPRFESPDWQPEVAPLTQVSAPEPLEPEPVAPPPPPQEYVQVPEPVPHPPPSSAAAPKASSALSPTVELDELMKKIRALSNK